MYFFLLNNKDTDEEQDTCTNAKTVQLNYYVATGE